MRTSTTRTLFLIASAVATLSDACAAITTAQKGGKLVVKGSVSPDVLRIEGLDALGELSVSADGGSPISFAGVRDLEIALGNGDDTLELSSLQIGGSLEIKTGAGDDQVRIDDDGITVDRTVFIGKNVKASLGNQPDDFMVFDSEAELGFRIGGNLTVTGAAQVRLIGEGGSSASELDDLVVGGDLRIRVTVAAPASSGGLTVKLGDSNVGGKARIDLAAGSDRVKIGHSHFVRKFALTLGGGDDVLEFEDKTNAFDAEFACNGGAGFDAQNGASKTEFAKKPVFEKFEELEALPN